MPLFRCQFDSCRSTFAVAAALAAMMALSGCTSTQTATRTPPEGGREKRELSFDEFLDGFRTEAAAAGIRKTTVDQAFEGLVPNDRVMALMESQPEFVRPIWDYIARTVSERGSAKAAPDWPRTAPSSPLPSGKLACLRA